MHSCYFVVSFWALMVINFSAKGQDHNWTHFRGSNMDGHAAVAKAPLLWNDSTNVVWQAEPKGIGWSSPVIYGNQVWVTSAAPDGSEFYTFCYELNTGRLLDEKVVFTATDPQSIHSTNSYATPTPCIEQDFAYVHYGTFGTACIRTSDFSIVWKREDLECNHMQGPASSPVLFEDKLILHLEGTENPYVIALNKNTGETIWKSVRPAEKYDPLEPVFRKSFQTPIIIESEGKMLMISNASFMCFAHDVNTGEVVWTLEYGYDSTVSQPLYWNGLVFVNSGWIFLENTPYFSRQYAVDPSGHGDITKSHVKWMAEDEVPQIPTPVIVDGKMYMVHDRGMVSCLDAMTGKVLWKHKLKGNFNSSPVYAAGNIYFFNVKGDCTIIKPGESFHEVASNHIRGTVKAVPVFVGDMMILRTDSRLMAIKQP